MNVLIKLNEFGNCNVVIHVASIIRYYCGYQHTDLTEWETKAVNTYFVQIPRPGHVALKQTQQSMITWSINANYCALNHISTCGRYFTPNIFKTYQWRHIRGFQFDKFNLNPITVFHISFLQDGLVVQPSVSCLLHLQYQQDSSRDSVIESQPLLVPYYAALVFSLPALCLLLIYSFSHTVFLWVWEATLWITQLLIWSGHIFQGRIVQDQRVLPHQDGAQVNFLLLDVM